MENIRDAYIELTLQPEAKVRTVREVYQYDYGIKLKLDGADTDKIVELHFAHEGQKQAIEVIPEQVDGYVIAEIPKVLLEQRRDIFCYIYIESGSVGYTVYEIKMPVRKRARPTDSEYTEDEVENYDRLVARLNEAINDVYDLQADFENMNVVAESLPDTAEATANWDSETSTLTIGVPRSPATGDGAGYVQQVYNAQTHFEFPSVGSPNVIYKAEAERKIYQWNQNGLMYETISESSGGDLPEFDVIYGGDANGD